MSSFDINVEKIGEVEGESRFEMSFSSPVLYKGDHDYCSGIDGSVGIFDLNDDECEWTVWNTGIGRKLRARRGKNSQMRALPLLAIAIKETENFNISKTATTVNFSPLIQHFHCGDSLQFLHCLIWRILYKKRSVPPQKYRRCSNHQNSRRIM